MKKLATDHFKEAVSVISNIMFKQPFTMGDGWPEIARLMEVYIMCYIWYNSREYSMLLAMDIL